MSRGRTPQSSGIPQRSSHFQEVRYFTWTGDFVDPGVCRQDQHAINRAGDGNRTRTTSLEDQGTGRIRRRARVVDARIGCASTALMAMVDLPAAPRCTSTRARTTRNGRAKRGQVAREFRSWHSLAERAATFVPSRPRHLGLVCLVTEVAAQGEPLKVEANVQRPRYRSGRLRGQRHRAGDLPEFGVGVLWRPNRQSHGSCK